ncbi:BETA-GLUCOSIDASE 45 [Salix viminalis]|uniref:BETA-GLUCOSIDASE 45 n=1 Tax=Salix viminalis TaxID=40686 RepID=A0A9Q0QHV6_SALVM|nr:BETA-GLUCOSIDASE 45 [Salix viminalis]
MDLPSIFKVLFLLDLIFLPLCVSSYPKTLRESLDRSSLPDNFLFGVASSSYQFEGSYLSDGKGLSNWDIHTHTPGKVIDGSNGDIAVDQYNLYPEDIDLMDSLGVSSYRFSISWARILPKFGDINKAGISYYNKLIDSLLLRGIQPFVTLVHYDIPQELEERYGGWLSPRCQEDFGYYADICFKNFGDRVKYWTTFNEPNIQAIKSYRTAHNMILAHATAVDIYRAKYQKEQGGNIGIVLDCIWFEQISNSTADMLAADRAEDFFLNWFLDPIIFGNYPAEMSKILGSNLPRFSRNDKEKLKNGLDFIGINHYTSEYVQDCIFSVCEPGTGASWTEGLARRSQENDGVPIGKPTDVDWLHIYPQGMEKMVTYIKKRYNNTPMIITENGCGQLNNPNLTIVCHDIERVEYMSAYWDFLLLAMEKGADVRGYFAWSLLDNFEWSYGYTQRYGLHHVDYTTLKRTPKLSATWFKEFIAGYKVEESQI